MMTTDTPQGFKTFIRDDFNRVHNAPWVKDNISFITGNKVTDGAISSAKITEGKLDYVTADEGYFGQATNSAFTRIDATTSIQELEYTAGQIIESKIKDSMMDRKAAEDFMLTFTIENTLDLEVAKQRSKNLYRLFNEYNIDGKVTDINLKKTIMKGTKPAPELGLVSTTKDRSKTFIADARYDNARFDGGASKCDANKMVFATDTHEFGHLMFTDKIKVNNKTQIVKSPFYTEAEKVFKAYKEEIAQIEKDITKANRTGDKELETELTKKYNDTYLGKYAKTDVGEFIAEGFQEYKNCSPRPEPKPGMKPEELEELQQNKYRTKYADIIGKLVNDNFRK
jgi:hypothetical protein